MSLETELTDKLIQIQLENSKIGVPTRRIEKIVVGAVTTTIIGNAGYEVDETTARWSLMRVEESVAAGTTTTTIGYPEEDGTPNAGFKFKWSDRGTLTFS